MILLLIFLKNLPLSRDGLFVLQKIDKTRLKNNWSTKLLIKVQSKTKKYQFNYG